MRRAQCLWHCGKAWSTHVTPQQGPACPACWCVLLRCWGKLRSRLFPFPTVVTLLTPHPPGPPDQGPRTWTQAQGRTPLPSTVARTALHGPPTCHVCQILPYVLMTWRMSASSAREGTPGATSMPDLTWGPRESNARRAQEANVLACGEKACTGVCALTLGDLRRLATVAKNSAVSHGWSALVAAVLRLLYCFPRRTSYTWLCQNLRSSTGRL